MRRVTASILVASTLVVAGGYYGVADALDLVPGPLTLAPPSHELQPFPAVTAQAREPEVAGLDPDAPLPAASALSALAQALADDDLVGTATTGVSVIDVATGTELVDHAASTPLTPASSNKVPVAWAALSALGADHRMTTAARLSGSTLTLVGGGDVLLAADAGDPGAVVGHAGLGDLARAAAARLTAQGVTSVSLALDDTLFTGPAWNETWDPEYAAWVAPVQPLMIRVSEREGAYPADPAMEAAEAFRTALEAAGVSVQGQVQRAAAPQGAQEVASVSSAPLADVLAVSLKASDNTMTEVEGRVLAAQTGYEATFAGATQAVTDQLAKDGFDTTGLVMHDCSGLSVSNKVPARLLAQIMARAAGPDGGTAGRTLVADLPVAALDGTLRNRLVGTAGAGTVRAKTGSLDQSASLTGTLVTKDGRLLAFSVITDGFADGGLASARAAIDQDLIVPLTQ